MKRLLWCVPLVMGLLGAASIPQAALAAAKKPAAHQKSAHKAKVLYVCQMDKFTSTKPGKCPKCGMQLTKVTVKPTSKPAPKKSKG